MTYSEIHQEDDLTDDIILNEQESRIFLDKLLHPDEEAIRCRERFLDSLKDTVITFLEDEILIQAKDITLDL